MFRPTRKDAKTGKSVAYKLWYIELRDHNETTRRLPAFTDRKQSEALGRNLERLVAARVNREAPSVELGRWLESLPSGTRDKLARIGLLDARAVASRKSLAEHLTDFEAALVAKGGVERHARAVARHAKRVIEGCGFQFWHELSPAKVQGFLAKLRDDDGLSVQTVNFHLQHAQQFCKWMVRERRASESPLAHLQGLNVATDRRHDRRELAADEARRLLQAAHNGAAMLGIGGAERALVYRLALESGLRANELHSLTRASFDFRAVPATVTVEAGSSKRRRRDTLPLRADTAGELQAHLASKHPGAKAFALPASDKTSRLIKADLNAARAAWLDEAATIEERAEREQTAFLAYVDDAGRYADFHSLRHTFISTLARSGVHPKVAQALARHSTITLTMDRYSHTVLGEQSEAVELLPSLATATVATVRATGTDDQLGNQNSVALCVARSGAVWGNLCSLVQ